MMIIIKNLYSANIIEIVKSDQKRIKEKLKMGKIKFIRIRTHSVHMRLLILK